MHVLGNWSKTKDCSESTDSVYEKEICHRSFHHPSALLGTIAGEPHISGCLHHGNTCRELRHCYKKMHLLSVKVRTGFCFCKSVTFFCYDILHKWYGHKGLFLVSSCNVILLETYQEMLLQGCNLTSAFTVIKWERMLHLQRAARYTAEMQFKKAFLYYLLIIPLY